MSLSCSFSELYDKYYDRCVAFARSYVFDEHEAKTIASDAIMVLWNREDFSGTPLAFLFGTIRNKALNYLRGKAREKNAIQGAGKELELRIRSLESCDMDAISNSEMVTIVDRTLSRLPSKTSTVFYMSRSLGLRTKEIAQRMNISEKAVEYHIGMALRSLRLALKDYLP